jgi:hypothetical protein
MTLLARKGYTLNGYGTLSPIYDVDAESPVNSHAAELSDDNYGREVSSLAVDYDEETGRCTTRETVKVVGLPRIEADNYAPVIEALAAEANRQFFDVAKADDDDNATEQSMWVEGEVMGIVSIIDDVKTAWYHAKLLNVYLDKTRGKLATGSVRFTISPANQPAFYCVRPGCECAVTFEGFAGNGLDFLWLAYVHGLNHGAAFAKPYGERVLNDPFLKEA